jgi:hypothetical protein
LIEIISLEASNTYIAITLFDSVEKVTYRFYDEEQSYILNFLKDLNCVELDIKFIEDFYKIGSV